MTVVITGANRGIGYEMAKVHAERGDRVIAGCRNPATAEALAALDGVVVLPLDISDDESVAGFAAAVGVELGGGTIDVLYNNAGTSTTAMGLDRSEAGVLDVPVDFTLELIRINGLSAATVTRSLVDHLGAGSKVANISSQLGSMVIAPMLADLPYNASKAVMNMVTVQLAAALKGRDIAVVCFHPGWVRTDMGGPHADLSPEESGAGIVSVVDGVTMEQTSSFFRHDGTIHPW